MEYNTLIATFRDKKYFDKNPLMYFIPEKFDSFTCGVTPKQPKNPTGTDIYTLMLAHNACNQQSHHIGVSHLAN